MGARPRRPCPRTLAGATAAVLLVTACGGGGDSSSRSALSEDGSSTTAGDSPGAVTVRSFAFQPSPLRVATGATVTWTNRDQTVHTVTSGRPGAPDGTFDQALDGKGATFESRFPAPGTYNYFCRRHESMTAQVIVS